MHVFREIERLDLWKLFLSLQLLNLLPLLGDLLLSEFKLLLYHCSLIKLVWLHWFWVSLHELHYLFLKVHLRVLFLNSRGRYRLAGTGLLSE